ncbi:MAG: AmmeMemoRadiSam system radical SAM enzyme [Chitinivibrionales bacterium]|nr:AmmeMemoRadiSam system radical SAM enzyme [Chitinivibrionales bacterium]
MEHDTHDAAFAEQVNQTTVRCRLCPHGCVLREGKRGICLTRGNDAGRLVTYNYSRPVSIDIDPIEKKPLYHYRPGAMALSMGPNGCTLRCEFCQNSEISQCIQPAKYLPYDGLVDAAVRKGTQVIAFTYSEPMIWFETIMALAPAASKRCLSNVMVTNGYIEPKPLRELLRVVDALNIDIKSMNPRFYHRFCKGRLAPVLRACEQTLAAGRHLEVTSLLVPGENDSAAELRDLTHFVAEHLGRNTPLHITRYFPSHHLTHDPTPTESLNRAYEIARERLDFVYVGNVPVNARSDTLCPKCGELLVSRRGYSAIVHHTCKKLGEAGSECKECGTMVNVIQRTI